MQHHNYSLTEIEDMVPFELDIYYNLLIQHLDKERERQQREANR